jgi:hypothetical protein
MMRPRRSVVFLCIAAIALAAFLPGVSTVDCVAFEPTWVLLPDLSSLVIRETTAAPHEQRRSLLSVLPSRAPPALCGAAL